MKFSRGSIRVDVLLLITAVAVAIAIVLGVLIAKDTPLGKNIMQTIIAGKK